MTSLSVFQHHPFRCAGCGGLLNMAMSASDRPPEAGDLMICARCEGMNVFLAEGLLRLATPEEEQQAKQDPSWHTAQRFREFKKRFERHGNN